MAKIAANARRVPRELERACPICADNGKAFTDRLSACTSGPRQGPRVHELTGWALTTDYPRRNLPGPTAWQHARVAVSGRSCKAIVSNRARHWISRTTAMSSFATCSSPNRPRKAKGHCRRCRTGTNSGRNVQKTIISPSGMGTSRSCLINKCGACDRDGSQNGISTEMKIKTEYQDEHL